ncbi:MAG: hypothetical protein UX91_C0006G0045 [Candidatus Amesbacteria bacterium GW2011_GWB1_47_19]|nr:MAG: hypothetical protein UW51_C0002G0045 [Candidatus Amesbacteria bacterium GW2011_GWA1_44_24]KKU31364.1 MAG: hypothetical protein UX46_C0006G0156 [Candidatus Amesbacteria bacterium GW2011_GWC1_46_24]KKU66983.1 MAG: hypothetical protein UX91_C0006G0045 [Candidatus Amesbacteria bacterium GW2011_GWB1_47_19]OGD05684.1 MAG: hypothetical protein A2379_05560 [Candidatus Amesbacteria bacterium RIFOXYB1_FULL_47_13]HBC72799.1 hypothetical protein [Candidatus Amesbacteria bacterium]
MARIPSLTVGIIAFNEAGNIGHILESVLGQNRTGFTLERILVISDGSSDTTQDLVRQFSHRFPLVQLVSARTRKGKPFRLNQLFRLNHSDILVALDADINLVGRKFLTTLVSAIVADPRAGMMAAHQIPLRPPGIAGGLIHSSFAMWDDIRLSVPGFNHVQNFYGAATAFRKSFSDTLRIPVESSELRLYIYLTAVKAGAFRYCRSAVITYWPPSTWSDYFKLANRSFSKPQPELDRLFGYPTVSDYVIPRKYLLSGILKSLRHRPLSFPLALFMIFFLSRFTRVNKNRTRLPWEMAGSTKRSFKPVLVISSYDDLRNPWYGGGGAVAVHEIAKRLAGHFDITVITGKYPFSSDLILDGVSYRRIGISVLGGKFGQLAFLCLIPFRVMFGRYDIWMESFTPPFSTAFLPLFTRKPVIGLAHMLAGADMQRKYLLPFVSVENLGLRLYRRIISPSPFYSKQIKKISPQTDVVWIPNGVTSPVYPADSAYRPRNISFIGRIEVNQKGLDLLLQSFKHITGNLPHDLYIAGSGSRGEINRLKSLINHLHLDSRAKLTGLVRGRERSRFFARTLVMALPSRFETFPLVALETLASGIPFVCFDIDGLKWLPDNCGIKVRAFDHRAFGEALIKLVNDPHLRQKLSHRAKLLAEKFSWKKTAVSYSDYLNKALL